MAIYEWSEQLHVKTRGVSLNSKVEAQIFGEQCEVIIARDGCVTSDALVLENKSPDSPGHKAFDWNNRSAAHRFRCEQAKLILRKIRVVYRDSEDGVPAKTIRAFSSVHDEDRKRTYVSTETAMREPDTRDQILMQALNQLRAWRHRWNELNEYSDALHAIDQAIDVMRQVVVEKTQ